MATYKDSPLTFIQTVKDSFYFKETECVSSSGRPETGICSDAFMKSKEKPAKLCWIQSDDHKFLVLKSEDFKFEDRTVLDQEKPDCKFCIQIYKDSQTTRCLQPVMLYICHDDQKLMVSCRNNKEVHAEPMDPKSVERIPDTKHKALFRWKEISTNKYKFESTVHEDHFLAVDPIQELPGHYRLILRPGSKDEVDESAKMHVLYC